MNVHCLDHLSKESVLGSITDWQFLACHSFEFATVFTLELAFLGLLPSSQGLSPAGTLELGLSCPLQDPPSA